MTRSLVLRVRPENGGSVTHAQKRIELPFDLGQLAAVAVARVDDLTFVLVMLGI